MPLTVIVYAPVFSMGVTATESKFFYCAYLPCTKASHDQIKNVVLSSLCPKKLNKYFFAYKE